MAKKPTNPAKPYTVGYCKPPLHSRFQPGHSGNDKGRPPQARVELPPGLDPIHAATLTVMSESVTIKTPGSKRGREVNSNLALMRTVRDQALDGNSSTQSLLLKRLDEAQGRAAELQRLSAANQELGDAVFIAVDVMRECKRLGGLDDAALAEEVRRAALAAEVRKREAASAAAAREPDARLGRRAQPHPGAPTPTPAPAPPRVEAAPPDPSEPPALPAAPARPRGPAPRRGRGDPLIPSRGPLILDGYGVGGGRQRTPGGGSFS